MEDFIVQTNSNSRQVFGTIDRIRLWAGRLESVVDYSLATDTPNMSRSSPLTPWQELLQISVKDSII